MVIRWLDEAVNDLSSLRTYISRDSEVAALKVAKRVVQAVGSLSEQPELGRRGRILDTRELIVPGTRYIVPYRVKNNVIEVLRVFHCSMCWPENILE